MSEFGKKVVPGQSVDRRLVNDQFDQGVVYDDNFIELAEKPPFSQEVSMIDLLLMEREGFNNSIISKAHNYTQDYFELRAQPGQAIGEVSVNPAYDYNRYELRPGFILFTRDGSGQVTNITTVNSVGTKTVDFTRVNGEVTEIDTDKYGTLHNIAFTRVNGEVTQIDITDTT